MEHKQQLELAQVLKLSPTLLQSMGILQMTTLELADYLQDLALENPVMEETPGARETAWDAFASRVPWLAGERMASGGPAVGFSLLLSTRCLVRLVCFPSLSLCRRVVRAASAIVFLTSSSFDTISQFCTPQQSDSLSFSCRLGLILSYALQGWSFRKRW